MTRKMTSSQKHAELKRLSKEIHTNIFQMARLASELLDDIEYVDSCGGEGALLDQLQQKEFSHFGGSPSVAQLVRAYRANGKEEAWRQRGFNVWAMIELANPPAARTSGASSNGQPKKSVKELEATLAEREAAFGKERSTSEATIAELQAKVEVLEKENRQLRRRIETLERDLNERASQQAAMA